MNNPSKTQQLATDPTTSVWVDASAGTGKTKVLTERVLRLLINNNQPGKILCITFTKAAAYEMHKRIHDQLLVWATCEQKQLKQLLLNITGVIPDEKKINIARSLFFRIIEDPYGLQIMTIHSFCQKILKQFSFEANVPNNFSLLMDSEQNSLLTEVIQGNVCGKELKNLAPFYKTISSIINSIKEIILNTESLQNLLKCDESLLVTDLEKHFDVNIHTETEGILDNYKIPHDKLKLIYQLFSTGGKSLQKRAENIKVFTRDNILNDGNFTDYQRIFFTVEGESRKSIASKEILEKNGWLNEFWQNEIYEIRKLISEITRLQACKISYYLAILAKKALLAYNATKEKNNNLDYNDLIFKTCSILENVQMSWVLYKLDGGIDHILIDESQDTSNIQWQIILKITEELFAGEGVKNNRTLFVVGDNKQSIYSFQGADPKLFTDLKKFFASKMNLAKKKWIDLSFSTSFRSNQAILDVVNDTLQNILGNSYELHKSFKNLDGGDVKLWSLVINKQQSDSENITTSSQELANKIANHIAVQISEKTLIPAKGRAVSAGDFMVLVQRRNTFMYQLVRSLKRHNVPVAGIDKFCLNDHIAIMDLIALIEFLLLPDNDYALLCVLKSPIFNFSENDLLKLQTENLSESLWGKLKIKYPAEKEILRQMLEKSKKLNPFEFFTYILVNKDYKQKFIARMGVEVIEVLEEFLKYVLEYSKKSSNSLLQFIEHFKKHNVDIKRDLSAILNAVRIMTVHGAKGLQAPIVILADTVYIPNKYPELLWHYNPNNNPIPICSNSSLNTVKETYIMQQKEEYLRLLYVAMTRAENSLIIAGYKSNSSIPKNCWYSLISNTMQNIAENMDDIYVYSLPQKRKILEKKQSMIYTNQDTFLPKCLLETAKQEPGEAEAISPSSFFSEKNIIDNKKNSSKQSMKHLLEGIMIHKLLEVLPKYPQNLWHKVTENIGKLYIDLDKSSISFVKEIAFSNLKESDFHYMFYGKESYAEVPISGSIGDNDFNGQIDRLIFKNNEIEIIDFKTSSKIEIVPQKYISQLEIYKSLLKKAYPNIIVRPFILWLKQKELIKIKL